MLRHACVRIQIFFGLASKGSSDKLAGDMAFLDEIVDRKRAEVAAAKKLRDLSALKRMIGDAPAMRSFSGALTNGFGLIAEIKRRSPSGGDMRKENVEQAPAAYAKSSIVKCVSVLTNSTDFGMGIE